MSRQNSLNNSRTSVGVTHKNLESGLWQGLSFLAPTAEAPGRGKHISPRYVKEQGNTRRTVEPGYPSEQENKGSRKKLIPNFELQSQVFNDAPATVSPARKIHLIGPEPKRNHASPDNVLARTQRDEWEPPTVSSRAARQYAKSNGSTVPFLPASQPSTPLSFRQRKENPQLRSLVFSPAVAQECLGAVPRTKRDLHQQSEPQPDRPPVRGLSAAKQRAMMSSVFSSELIGAETHRSGKRIASAAQSPDSTPQKQCKKRSSGTSPSLLSTVFS